MPLGYLFRHGGGGEEGMAFIFCLQFVGVISRPSYILCLKTPDTLRLQELGITGLKEIDFPQSQSGSHISDLGPLGSCGRNILVLYTTGGWITTGTRFNFC